MKTLEGFLSELRQRDVTIWLDGDRLRYRAPEGSLSPEELAQLRDRKAEIIAFLKTAKQLAGKNQPPLHGIPREGNLPLSFAQQKFWFLYQFEPDSPANNVPVVVRFTGNLDRDILKRSLTEVTRRHEVLRSTFPTVNGQPVVAIAPDLQLELPLIDLQNIPTEERDAEAHRIVTQYARQSIDLEKGPLLRVMLFRLAAQKHLMLWNMPAIICDGTSSDLFYREFTTAYVALSTGKPLHQLPELPIQYVDFAHWQRQHLQGDVLDSHLAYWKQQLSGNLPSLELPTDYPRPSGLQTYRGDRYACMFSKSLHLALINLSQQMGTTLFVVLLTAFSVLMHRYSQQNDILTSFVSSGRNRVETEGLIGFFSNTLMLRTQVDGKLSFRQLVGRIHQINLDTYAHQDLPFERLVDELSPGQRHIRSPLFQTKFTLNAPWTNGQGMAPVTLPNLTIESLFGYIYHGKTKFDIILVTREQDQGLGAVFDYNAEIFSKDTIERMMGHFQTLLESIVANPDQSSVTLPLLMSDEQQQLTQWNQTETPAPEACYIHQLLEATVDSTPDAIALVSAEQQYTYRELNKKANQLAHYLHSHGVSSEVQVALCMEQSPELVIGMLGILKAGATFVILDPTAPSGWQNYKLQEAQASLILTQTHLMDLLSDCPVKAIALDASWDALAQCQSENLPWKATTNSLAFVVYTNNAADTRGVLISHPSLVNYAVAISQAFELKQGDRILHPNMSFDAFAASLFSSWHVGATAVLCEPQLSISSSVFLQWISQQTITVLSLPTGYWHQFVNDLSHLQQPLPDCLRLVVVHGEKVSHSVYKTWTKLVGSYPRWLNAYGSPETTVTATIFDPVTSPDWFDTRSKIPIGKPIANLQAYVLDSNLQSVPIGVRGELYIGGVGISQGYLNQPELTQARFISNPFSSEPNARLYKTGDIVRYLPDGNLELVGRSDIQIRIQDFRVDHMEIETQLEQHPAIQQAIVVAQDASGEQSLVAYVVPEQNQLIDFLELQSFLKQKLLPHLIPADFVFVNNLPLTPQGQIDLHALPTHERLTFQTTTESLNVSRDEVEHQLTLIWEKVLGIQGIGIQDNFFDLGGHSLLAVRLFAEIEKSLDKNLPLSVLLQAPTIEQLAKVLREDADAAWSPLVEIQPLGNKPPLFCVHGGGFNVLIYRDLALNLGTDRPVYGLQARGLREGERVANRMEEMATDYIQEIRRVQPSGPYFLAGLSNGGNIALEMAQQLQMQGEQVALLAMFDTYAPGGIRLLPSGSRFMSSLNYLIRYSLPRVAKTLQSGKGLSLTNVLKFWQKQSNHTNDVSEKTSHQSNDSPKSKQSSVRSLEEWMNCFSQYVLEHSPWSFFLPKAQLQGINGSLSERLKTLEDMYEKVHASYMPKSYSGRITLFRAKECPPGYQRDFYLGWKQIAMDGVEVHKIPGHHTSLMTSPVLAQKLKVCLEKAHAGHVVKVKQRAEVQ